MLIDLFTSCATIVKCSYYDSTNGKLFTYDSTNGKLFTDSYSVKSFPDIKSLMVTTSVSSLNLTFIVSETKRLKDIIYEIKGYDHPIKIETSLDYLNWYELPYKSDDKYLYKESVSGTFYNTDLNEYTNTVSGLNYSFFKSNKFNKDIAYVYDNLEFKFIRFTFETPSDNTELNPIYFADFQILIEDNFEKVTIDNNLLELKSGMFTKSKIFEEEEFLPDMIKNYMKIIEESNSTLSNLNFVSLAINDNTLNFSPEEGIEDDFIGLDTVIY